MYSPPAVIPLSAIPDAELARKVKETADSAAMSELITRHSGVYHNCTKSFLGNPLFSYEDSMNEKPFTIYSAAMVYNPDRGAFGTFLGVVTKSRCLQIIKEKRRYSSEFYGEINFDEFSSKGPPIQEELEARDGLNAVQEVVGGMSESKQRLFSKRFLTHNDNSGLGRWDKIAKSEGKTKWGCILSTRTVQKKVREKVGMELVGRKY